MKSCKLKGGDLKAEGSYVVGAGSQITGKQWMVINDQLPLHLSKTTLKRVLTTFKALKKMEVVKPSLQHTGNNDFVSFYRREVLKSGQRNNSLFKTALWMCDSGHLQHEAIAALAHIHANYPGLSSASVNQNYESRYREAVATIASAYSRPPRQRTIEADETGSRLSNTLREGLLKQTDGAAFLRTYEGLLLHGITGGQIVTRPQMFKLLRGIVGEHSIKLALKIAAPDGNRYEWER